MNQKLRSLAVFLAVAGMFTAAAASGPSGAETTDTDISVSRTEETITENKHSENSEVLEYAVESSQEFSAPAGTSPSVPAVSPEPAASPPAGSSSPLPAGTAAELSSAAPAPTQAVSAVPAVSSASATPAPPKEANVTHRPDDTTPTPKPTVTPSAYATSTPAPPREAGVTRRPDDTTPTPKPTVTASAYATSTPAPPREAGITHRPDDATPTPKPTVSPTPEGPPPTPESPREPWTTATPTPTPAEITGTVDADPKLAGQPGSSETEEDTDGEPFKAGPEENTESSSANLSGDARKAEEELAQLLERVTVTASKLDQISFAEIERRMRTGNHQILSFQATIDYLETMDYQKLTDDMRKQLNGLAEAQFALSDLANMTGQNTADSYAYNQLTQGYSALRKTFDDLKNGETLRDNLSVVRQLRNAQNQYITGGETLYITLVGLETQKGALDRQITSLNRVVETMDLQYQQGNISSMQLQQYTSQRASLISARETLGMNIRTLKMQLENMLGASPTGEIRIGSLPSVTEAMINAMNVESDLKSAMAKSYELHAAAKTLENQEETYEDAGKAARYKETNESYRQATSAWEAAKSTYNATLQGYELRFRTLYEQVHDYYQVWNTSKTTLANQQNVYAAAELRYEQGNISHNALLNARDELESVQETVATNANNLFSAYNSYCWAKDAGILN